MMLEGKIVAILSKTEVLIDIGLKHGVKDEMVFAIKNPETIEVKDVDGENVIGEFSRTKGYIIAKEVYEKFTYCVTRVKEYRYKTPITNMYESFFSGTVRKPEELKVDPKEITEIAEDSTVHVGDKVIRI